MMILAGRFIKLLLVVKIQILAKQEKNEKLHPKCLDRPFFI